MRGLQLRVSPLLRTAVCQAAIALADRLLPGTSIELPGHQPLAIAFAATGAVILAGAALLFWRQRTTLDPRTPGKANRCVARGLIRLSRNPMCLGMALILLGAAT